MKFDVYKHPGTRPKLIRVRGNTIHLTLQLLNGPPLTLTQIHTMPLSLQAADTRGQRWSGWGSGFGSVRDGWGCKRVTQQPARPARRWADRVRGGEQRGGGGVGTFPSSRTSRGRSFDNEHLPGAPPALPALPAPAPPLPPLCVSTPRGT